ncbi:MAG: hypothetical protein ACYC63_06060 [Armatimonadota bacterium]
MADSISRAANSRPLLLPVAGVVISIVLAVLLNKGLVFDPYAQQKWSTSPDSVAITQSALAADARTVVSWWHGPWIEREMFYRPLSSMLMWAEARLWGYNFFPYTIVSLTLHALSSALVFLLLYSMCPGPRWQRALSGLVAMLLFNLGHHPSGPYWERARVAWGTMIWWPVQTDFASLLFSLLSLLLLDRYLLQWQRAMYANGWHGRSSGRAGAANTAVPKQTSAKPTVPPAAESGLECDFDDSPESCLPRLTNKYLMLALVSFLIALLFKETPLVLIGIVPFMCLYRWVPWIKVTGSYAAIGVTLAILRTLFVPQASNPEWLGVYTFYKILSFVHLLTAELLANWEVWEVVAMATLLGLVYLLRRLRVPTLYAVLACVIWPFLIAALLSADHNPALATIDREMLIQLRLLAVYSGFLIALITAGREPALVFIIGLFAVAMANVNRVGPHYWYYTAMMWGLVDGAVFNAAINLLREWRT